MSKSSLFPRKKYCCNSTRLLSTTTCYMQYQFGCPLQILYAITIRTTKYSNTNCVLSKMGRKRKSISWRIWDFEITINQIYKLKVTKINAHKTYIVSQKQIYLMSTKHHPSNLIKCFTTTGNQHTRSNSIPLLFISFFRTSKLQQSFFFIIKEWKYGTWRYKKE